MELRHLKYFIAVAEAENVSRAALKLHVSQPGLSRQIRDLEDELGFPLLERTAKSVHMTNAGRVFLEESRAVIKRAEEAVGKARLASAPTRTELHVGYAMSPTVKLLPAALRAFPAEWPHVRVKLHDLSTGEMLAGLREGKLQLAILVHPGAPSLRGIRTEQLATMTVCLATPRNHPLARRRSVTIAEIAKQPLVAYSKADYPEYHEMLEKLFAGAKAKPRIAEEHDSVASLISAVEAGGGVALVTESIQCISGPRLKLVSIMPAPQPLVIAAAWIEKRFKPEAAAFLECARKAAREE